MNKTYTFKTLAHKSQKLNISYVTSVRPSFCPMSTYLFVAPAGRISVICNVGEVYKNVSRDYKLWLKSDKS